MGSDVNASVTVQGTEPWCNLQRFTASTTRVFMADAFWLTDGALVAHVSDDQQDRAIDVAHHFLSTFLGFRFQRHPRIVTAGFVTTVRRFISTR